jgi:hypothetical protein
VSKVSSFLFFGHWINLFFLIHLSDSGFSMGRASRPGFSKNTRNTKGRPLRENERALHNSLKKNKKKKLAKASITTGG